MTPKFVSRIASLCVAAVMAVGTAVSLGSTTVVEAASGTGLENVAKDWAKNIEDNLYAKSDAVYEYEYGFLDENKGDIRKLTVDKVTENVFDLKPTRTENVGPEHVLTYTLDGGWTMKYSMTRSYGTYLQNPIDMYCEALDASLRIVYDEDSIDFYFAKDGKPSTVSCASVDLKALDEAHTVPRYPTSIIVTEGDFVASPYELAIVGILSESAKASPVESVMTTEELNQAKTYYTNYCNNQKASASRAAECVEALIDSGKDIRDITVLDVLNEMGAGGYKFKLGNISPGYFEYFVEGSDNIAKLNVGRYPYGEYYNPSEITMEGKYKKTDKAFKMVVKPVFDQGGYHVHAQFSSSNALGGTTPVDSDFVINEGNFNNYFVHMDDSDEQIDCAVIAQIYGVLVWGAF